jgi:hypothetical protein
VIHEFDPWFALPPPPSPQAVAPRVMRAACGATFITYFCMPTHPHPCLTSHCTTVHSRFNYRATEYLDQHGWHAFFHWFDYESWYPLGRPVGTTIYPGMQITSVIIKRTLNAFGNPISLNDVCCYVPAWFGVTATWALSMLTTECSGSKSCGAAAALIMSIIPAHIMRSVGGGYDNESIAMTAMCLTFWLWVRALRPDPAAAPGEPSKSSYVYGVLAGFAYIYMVMAWGGTRSLPPAPRRAAVGSLSPAPQSLRGCTRGHRTHNRQSQKRRHPLLNIPTMSN